MRRKGPQRNAEKEQFWREAICRQRRSGLSVRGFCRDETLSEPSFYAWRRELRQRGGSQPVGRAQRGSRQHVGHSQRRAARRTAFVAVQLAAGASPLTTGAIELALPNGAVLRLPASIEPATVAAIVNAWERERC
jgi:transposase-like protein